MADDVLDDKPTSSETSEANDEKLLAEDETTSPSETDEVEEDEEVESDEEDDEPQSEEEETEEVEETKELSEEEQEQEKLITRPSWKELKEKFPGIEKNREFREIYFREKAYTEVFPTVEDAKEAEEKSRIFEYFNTSIADGTPDALIKALTPEASAGFAEKILPSLRAHNQELFVRATKPLLVDIVNSIYQSAESREDKNLQTSVLNVCKYLFGEFKLPARESRRLPPEIQAEREALRRERESLVATKQGEFHQKAESSIDRQLRTIIKDGLNIENEFTSNSVVEEAVKKVKNTLNSDKSFQDRLVSIFRQAEKAGFTPEFQTRIVSAYLGRAKGIALTARAELRAAALGKRSSKGESETTRRVSKTETGNKGTKERGKTNSKADLRNTRELSDLDILNMS